jgi:hypothetical protein
MSDFSNLRAARQAQQRKSFASRTVSANSKDVLDSSSDENFHAALPSMLDLVVSSEKGREIQAKAAFQPGKQPHMRSIQFLHAFFQKVKPLCPYALEYVFSLHRASIRFALHVSKPSQSLWHPRDAQNVE